MSGSKIDISILIPSYNEENTIINKLNDIIHLNYPKDRMETIIEDCSNDNTVNLIMKFSQEHKDIRIILNHDDDRKGVSYAINRGKASAHGDIIVRTDADSTLEKDCLNIVLETFKDEKIGCVTGKSHPIGSIKEEKYRGINTKIQLFETKIDSTIIAHGPFTAFRRKIPVVIDEDVLTADDSEISVRIRKFGYRSVLDPNIIFYEKTSVGGRDEQKIRRAAGLIALLWRNSDVLFNLKYGLYGMIVFPFNFFLTIVLPLILSPLLLILILFSIKGGTELETFQFLLKAIHRLLFTKKATMFWEKDNEIRGT